MLRSITVAAACIVSSAAWADTAPTSGKIVVQSLRELGLRPAGEKGYLQSIRYREQVIAPERSSVALTSAAGDTGLALGQNLTLDLTVQQPRALDAGLAFVGYGLPSVLGSRDDFAGQDLAGKVAVYIDATPLFLSAEQARAARSLAQAAAERAGAVGLIAIDASPEAWAARREAWTPQGRYLADSALQATRAPQFDAAIDRGAAERLFAASGRDLDTLLNAASAGRPLPGFALEGRLQARLDTQTRAGAAEAVLAVMPGADAYLGRNSVVVSASMADAPALVALAKDAAAAGASKRSVVFALLPTELRGDLAARALVDRLGAARDTVVAAIHLEQAADGAVGLAAASESSLGETATAVAANVGVSLSPSGDSRVAAGFALAGAPSIGLKASGAEHYLAVLTRTIADNAQRPSWKLDSPFARPDPRAQENLIAPLEMPVGKRPQRILPVYGALQATRPAA